MSKFFDNWKSFKDDVKIEKPSKLLKEFTRDDKFDLLSRGGDFTVSYEIEMVSKDYIDSEGEIISPTSARDVSTMSSFDQVEYLNYHDNIEEQANNLDAIDYLFHNIYESSNNRFNNLDDTAIMLIAEAKNYSLGRSFSKLSNNDIGSFLIAGHLDKNPQAEALIVNAENSKQKIMDRIENYPAQNEDEKEEIQTFLNMANRTDDFSRDLALLLGLEGDELTLNFTESSVDRMMLFEHIIGKEIEDKEVQDLNNVCDYLFPIEPKLKNIIEAAINKKTTKQVWDRDNKKYVYARTPYADYQDFKEFNLALNSLSGKASDKIQDLVEHLTNNFDYHDYGINLEDYNAYDSNEGDQPPHGASGENALDKFLPNFWSKYGKDMDAVEDLSLPRNQSIEIKMKTFITGLQDAVRYLDLFFQDFDDQNNFYFSNDTGLHTNISMNVPDKKFNILKGLLFLSEEETKPGKVPYAYKGTETRFTNQDWSKPLKNKAFESIKQQISRLNKESKDRLLDAYRNNDFEFVSDYINEMAKRYTHGVYVKGYGFNTQYTDTRGYIEFRYPGHQLTKEDLVNLTLYYAYIVKLTLDPNYKREEYNVRLVKLLQDVLPSTDAPSAFGDVMKDYKVFLDYVKKHAWNFENKYDLDRALAHAKNRFAYNTFYYLKDQKGLPVESFQDFVDGWPIVKAHDGANSVVENIIAIDPTLKDKIIQRFSKYRNIPAYRYCVATLIKYKNSDVKLFTAALGSLESILNNVYHDIHNYDVTQRLFSHNRNILPDTLSEITDDLADSFIKYYETHKDEFRYENKPQQPISESVFDKYEKSMDNLYIVEGDDPKVGTGKKPKGSGRRLYTDEDPSDTVSVKFSTAEDIRDTLSKESFKSKPHARQSQIINLIHQRVRAAYQNAKDPEVKARLKKALSYAIKRKEASKRKTASLQKEEEVLTEKCWPGYTQKGMKTMFGKKYPNCVKKTKGK